MSSEREVSKMFVRYMQRVLRNERINFYRKHLRDVKEPPLEDWLLEEIVEPSHLSDFLLIENEVDNLESFIENEKLSKIS